MLIQRLLHLPFGPDSQTAAGQPRACLAVRFAIIGLHRATDSLLVCGRVVHSLSLSSYKQGQRRQEESK